MSGIKDEDIIWDEHSSSVSDEDIVWDDENKTSELESAGRGVLQGASMGFADEISGGVEALWNAAKGDPRTFGEMYQQYRDESRENFKAAEKANPKLYGAGEIGGAIGTAFIPGVGAASGARLATVVGKSALQGGLTGLGASESESYSDLAKDAVKGAGIGAVGGAVGHGIGKGFQKLANSKTLGGVSKSVGDKLDDVAESQAYKAIDPTGSQMRGLSAASDLDTMSAMGRRALDEGIISDGLKTAPRTILSGLDGTASVDAMQKASKRALSGAHDDLNSFIASQGNKTIKKSSLLSGLDDLVDGLNAPIDSDSSVRSLIEKLDDNISLEDAIDLRKRLGKLVNWEGNKQSPEARLAEKAYNKLNDTLDSVYQGYKGIRDNEAIMNKIDKGLISSSKAPESITKSDLITGALGFGAGGPFAAAGTLAGKKMVSIHGNQMAAMGANKISEIVKKTPQALGKFAPTLQKAAERGGTALAATHFVLQQTDPEYRQLVLQSEDSKDEQEE